MDVELPNGVVIEDVPDGTSKEEIKRKAISAGLATEADFPSETNPPAQHSAQHAQVQPQQPTQEAQVQPQQPDFSKSPEQQPLDQVYEPQPGVQKEQTTLAGLPVTMYRPEEEANPTNIAQMTPSQIAVGGLENITQMATGALGTLGGVAKSTYDKLTGEPSEKAAKDLMETQEALTYHPKTQAGEMINKGIGEVLHPIFSPIQNKLNDAADYIEKDLNSPLAAAHVRNALNELPYIGELGKIGRLGRVAEASEEATRATPKDINAPATIMKAANKRPKVQEARANEIAAAFNPDIERVEAAKRLGIEGELLPSSTAKNQQAIELERGLASIPASHLSEKAKNETEAIAQKADDLITDFGGSHDKATLSDEVRDNLASTIDGLESKSDELYDKIDQVIPKKAKVDIGNIKSVLQEEAENMGGEERLAPILGKFFSIANNPKGVTYAFLDNERKDIGRAIDKSKGIYKDERTAILNKMYSLITDAMGVTADKYGMGDVWDTAKALVSKRKDLEKNSIKLLGENLANAIVPEVGKSIQPLSNGNYGKFDKLMSILPESERQKVVMSALGDVFTGGSRKEKQLSLPGFVDWMEGLNRNKAAKARLYKNMPEGASERLEDMAKVAKGIRDARAQNINTGRLNTLVKKFDSKNGLMAKLYGVGKIAIGATIGSHFGPIGSSIGSALSIMPELLSRGKNIPLTQSADEMLASPEFRKAIVSYAKAGTDTQREAIERAVSRNKKVRQWVSEMSKTGAKGAAQTIRAAGVLHYLTQPEQDKS